MAALSGIFIGPLVSVLLVALVLWVMAEMAARGGGRVWAVARWAFLILVLMTAHWNHLAVYFVRRIVWGCLALWVVLTVVVFFLLARFQQRAVHAIATLLVILSPFVLVTFAQMGWWIYEVNARMASADNPPAGAMTSDPSKPRVVWIIFDELDLRQAFLERVASVKLPEFDRLRGEALFAENAYPPHRITEMSLPSLLTGKMIAKVEPIGTDDLAIWLEGEPKPRRWSREPTTLSAASALGRNVDLVGWYHPYCRVFSGLQRCYWEDISLLFGELHRDPAVWQAVRDELIDIPNIGWQLRL